MSKSNHQQWVKKKTSKVMLDLPNLPGGEKITLKQMLEYMRGRAFGMVMVLLAVLSLVPNLFGHVILTGILMAVLGAQMVMGFTHIHLPMRILKMSFSRSGIRKVMNVAAPKIAHIEKLLKPRLIFMTEDIGRRIIGGIVIPLAILILIPFPFSNLIPVFSILVLSLGLIEKDGLVVLIGILISTSALILVNELMERFL